MLRSMKAASSSSRSADRRRRRRAWLRLPSAVALLAGLCMADTSRAHDLSRDELMLWVEPTEHVLRGQLTLNPHRTRRLGSSSAKELSELVVSDAATAARIEIDGMPCRAAYDVRELWVQAGPTVGDIVMLRCDLSQEPRRLRVRAGSRVDAIVVSVRASSALEAPVTRSVVIAGGSVSPPYRFAEPSPEWAEGVALAFEPIDQPPSLASGHPNTPIPARATAPPRISSACSRAQRSISGGSNHGRTLSTFLVGLALGGARWNGRRRLRKP